MEAIEGVTYWLVVLFFAKFAFLQHPRDGTTHRELGTPPSIFSQVIAPQACPQAMLVGAFSQLRFPLPK